MNEETTDHRTMQLTEWRARQDCPWPRRDAELIELWKWRGSSGEWHSSLKIGAAMRLTKNQIIGRVARLVANGVLTARPSPIVKIGYKAPKRKWKPLKLGEAPMPRLESDTPLATPDERQSVDIEIPKETGRTFHVNAAIAKMAHSVSIFDNLAPRPVAAPAPLAVIGPARKCQWPFGDPHKSGFHFCEAPSMMPRSYCPDHCKLAYTKIRDGRDMTAAGGREGVR
jgi:hypothetical protein